ncbi:hypothetical protein VKT23_018142 [Stygiomarasmius scandens]|uniref:Uncharacterized protein n=1 Tax=Marasmiellus scandens TaxID=2682957 RepID=A0ABR1IQ93_9AGAR
MLFFPLLIIAGASIVSSTPVSRQENSCLPNAMGAGVSFINWHFDRIPYMELGIGSVPQAGVPLIGSSFRSQNITLGWYTADWHLQQNGQDPPSYIIRDIDNNNLAVTSPDGVNLVLEQASDSGNEMYTDTLYT